MNIPEAGSQVLNICADKAYSIKELAETVIAALEISGELRFLPPRNEVVHAYADHSKAKRVFGFTSAIGLEEGIRKMTGWAKQAGIRKSSKFENIEILEKLPAMWLED